MDESNFTQTAGTKYIGMLAVIESKGQAVALEKIITVLLDKISYIVVKALVLSRCP